MPSVIYLPADNRWSDVGKGLGSLLSAYVGAQMQNKVASGVGEIINDPQYATPQAQLAEITKRFGQPGLQSWTNQVSALAKSAQLSQIGQQARLTGATAAKTEQLLPGELAEQKAQREQQEAATRLSVEGVLPETQAKTAQLNAALPGTTAESTMKRQQAEMGMGSSQAKEADARQALITNQGVKTRTETDVLEANLKGMKALLSPIDPNAPNSPTGADQVLDQQGITDPANRAFAKAELATKGVAGWNAALSQLHRDKTKLETQDALPSDVRKSLDTSAGMAPSLEPFLTPSNDASATGFAAGVKAYFAKKGLTTDPDILTRLTAGEQAMAQFAESGSGFGGSWRAKLGAQVTPQVEHSAVHNVIATDQIATQELAKLQQTRQQMEGVPKYKNGLTAIDSQIEQWKGIKDKAGSMWWGFDRQDGKGNGQGAIHFYYQGQEIDPKTLQPLPQASSYNVKGGVATTTGLKGQTVSVDAIRQAARLGGLTPVAVATQLGIQQ